MVGAIVVGIVIFALGLFLLWVLVYASGVVRPRVQEETAVTGPAAMERKVLLATGLIIAIGLVMTVYGFFDPIRQASARERQLDTSMERGVETYGTLCFACHGIDGKGAVVPGTETTANPRVTPQINRDQFADAWKGDPLFADSYGGDPDEYKKTFDLVYKTIQRGRPGTPMPAWGQTDGGTLNDEQINELALFITHGSKDGAYQVRDTTGTEYEGDTPWATAKELIDAHTATGTSPTPIPPEVALMANVPPEARAGADLFSKNGCAACHSTQPNQTLIGPSLAGVYERAGTREPGKSADDYIKESVRTPSTFIVPGFSGPPSPMPIFTPAQISDEQLGQLIEFLKTLK